MKEGETYTYRVSSRNSNDPEVRVWTIIGQESISLSANTENEDSHEDDNQGGGNISSKNVLLVGNSYIRYRQSGYPSGSKFSVNEQFESMLQARVSGATVMTRGIGGGTLKDHWDKGVSSLTARGMILSGDYDTLVLNGKTGNMRTSAGRKQFHEYADRFSDLANSKGMKIVFYGLWAHDSYISVQGGDIDGPRAHTEYTSAATRNNALYSPNGMVYSEVYKKLAADMGDSTGRAVEDLMTQDSRHPDVNLAFLAASTLYSTVTGEKSPSLSAYKPSVLSESYASMYRDYSWQYYNQYKINNEGGDSHDDDNSQEEDEEENTDDEETPLEADFSKLLAFPGAIGHGQNTVGGRGGRIIIVDTLEDIMDRNDGKTSLREAVQYTREPRTVVFAVGGIFDMTNPKYVGSGWDIPKHSTAAIHLNGKDTGNLTIAGQTAPNPGVIIRGTGFRLNGVNEVIVRYIKMRNVEVSAPSFRGNDSPETARNFFLTSSAGPVNNIVLDHATASWSTDDSVVAYSGKWDTYKGNHMTNITFSNSIIAEGDGRSSHPESAAPEACSKGVQSGKYESFADCPNMVKITSVDKEYKYGKKIWVNRNSCHNPATDKNDSCNFMHSMGPKAGSLRKDTKSTGISMIGNFIAHNDRRNARLSSGDIDYVNNVIYNWRGYGLLLDTWAVQFGGDYNILGNYFKAGPQSVKEINGSRGAFSVRELGSIKLNLQDNKIEGGGITMNKDWARTKGTVLIEKVPGNSNLHNVVEDVKSLGDIKVDLKSTNELLQRNGSFFSCVGDSRWRDAHDTRIIQEFFDGNGRAGIGNDHVRDWSIYSNNLNTDYYSVEDTDADGMNDAWERANGMNVGQKDSNGDRNNNGYTNIEEYMATLGCSD